MILAMRVVGILAGLAFAGQLTLAAAAEEPKKEEPKKEKKAQATPAPKQSSGGIQSNKAKSADSPRLTKGRSCSGDTPKIKKISPDEGKVGAKVTITGENFGEPGCITMVSFGPGSPAKFTQVDDRTITVTVPEGKKGMEFLTVTGATSQDTKPFLRK